MSKQMCRDKTS